MALVRGDAMMAVHPVMKVVAEVAIRSSNRRSTTTGTEAADRFPRLQMIQREMVFVWLCVLLLSVWFVILYGQLTAEGDRLVRVTLLRVLA